MIVVQTSEQLSFVFKQNDIKKVKIYNGETLAHHVVKDSYLEAEKELLSFLKMFPGVYRVELFPNKTSRENDGRTIKVDLPIEPTEKTPVQPVFNGTPEPVLSREQIRDEIYEEIKEERDRTELHRELQELRTSRGKFLSAMDIFFERIIESGKIESFLGRVFTAPEPVQMQGNKKQNTTMDIENAMKTLAEIFTKDEIIKLVTYLKDNPQTVEMIKKQAGI